MADLGDEARNSKETFEEIFDLVQKLNERLGASAVEIENFKQCVKPKCKFSR